MVTKIGSGGKIKIVLFLALRVTSYYRVPPVSAAFLELAYIKPKKSNLRKQPSTHLTRKGNLQQRQKQ